MTVQPGSPTMTGNDISPQTHSPVEHCTAQGAQIGKRTAGVLWAPMTQRSGFGLPI